MFKKLKAEIAKKADAGVVLKLGESLLKLIDAHGALRDVMQKLICGMDDLDRRQTLLRMDVDACKKKLDPASHGPSIYAIIEDLRARMPKGSAVSDYRFDELVGKVARLQRQLDEINTVFQNARREHEQTLAELEAERRTNVKRVEAKALPA